MGLVRLLQQNASSLQRGASLAVEGLYPWGLAPQMGFVWPGAAQHSKRPAGFAQDTDHNGW